MQAPTIRFATSTMSHFVFLMLLMMATVHIGENYPEITSIRQLNDDRLSRFSQEEKMIGLLRENLRPASYLFTKVLYIIIIFTLGMGFTIVNFLLKANLLKIYENICIFGN